MFYLHNLIFYYFESGYCVFIHGRKKKTKCSPTELETYEHVPGAGKTHRTLLPCKGSLCIRETHNRAINKKAMR